MGDTFYYCLDGLRRFRRGCTPPCAEWAFCVWAWIDVSLLSIGVFILVFLSWVLLPDKTALYVGLGLFISGVIPWIIYGLYHLYLLIGVCYRRYEKQYTEYKNINTISRDIENQNTVDQLLMEDDDLDSDYSDDFDGRSSEDAVSL